MQMLDEIRLGGLEALFCLNDHLKLAEQPEAQSLQASSKFNSVVQPIPIHTFLIAARHCYETRILPPPHAAMVQQGLLARISRTGVWEYWHAFGISEGKNSNEHFLICGVQGDFTQGLVNNTPTHIWTHELKVEVTFTHEFMLAQYYVVRRSLQTAPEPSSTGSLHDKPERDAKDSPLLMRKLQAVQMESPLRCVTKSPVQKEEPELRKARIVAQSRDEDEEDVAVAQPEPKREEPRPQLPPVQGGKEKVKGWERRVHMMVPRIGERAALGCPES
ncbi:hypothetical protein JOM56_014818 [Amanita muscaria]